MLSTISAIVLQCLAGIEIVSADELARISVIDLTHPTNWKDLSTYYNALEKGWKMCMNCGVPSLGTAMHLEHIASVESMHPAVIPPEYFLTERLSYELAEWISANLSHVVGVATDAPTLESDQTREFSTRTISAVLGKNGVYMIENVNVKSKIPEQGCMAIVSPLKLLNANYVPTRLTAYCPTAKTHSRVALTLNKRPARPVKKNRIYDIELDEIMY